MRYSHSNEGECMVEQQGHWALILGASSGFGAAIAREFAHQGYHIAGVHLDRRATMGEVEAVLADIRAAGVEARFFNINAADEEKRAVVIAELTGLLRNRNELGRLRVLVHSLAFGALKPMVAEGEVATAQHLTMTLEVMANTLVYWTQGVIHNKLMGEGGRIFALTSAGGHRVWRDYGIVSAAKAALEAHIRQLAVELAPLGITANAIQAGVTDTPALRKVPSYEEMMAKSLATNPYGRLTTPRDVAAAIAVLAQPGTAWITGNVIRADGGEDLMG
ncbi:MAG: Enoyl-(acyl-carrier-protein) reductase (NADPH) FabL [bacterium ADurb.Bin429]|nr:MAG: Enoyl-(acyl-carrier-protein) reductase (NADPH) FabL [bacterium ADurb.Bin429]